MAASRESQGMQIATIIFAVLTILLAITTYIFYAQSEENLTLKEAAEAKTRTVEQQNAKLLVRSQVLQYVIGDGNIERTTVDNLNLASDDVAPRVLKQFDQDMAMVPQAGEPGATNYRMLPQYLVSVLANKQVAMVDSSEETKRVQAKSTQDLTAEQARTVVAETAQKKAEDDLGAERGKFVADRTAITAEKEKVASQVVAAQGQLKKEREDGQKQVAALTAELNTVRNTAQNLKEKVIENDRKTVNRFEAPDGRITLVSQSQRLAWINLGQADGLQRQTTFAVFDHDENGVAQAEPKARIEVVRIAGEHLSECRILEDEASNPILPNDMVFTPAWSPGLKVHFALVGFMDINRDGLSDRDQIRNFIKMSGGIIDAELHDDGTRVGTVNVNTRYLVLGEKPTEKSGVRMLQEYNQLLVETSRYGTETISVQKLLAMMGVKPEERTVELGASAGKNEFKKRLPPRAGAVPAGAGAGAGAAADPLGGATAPAPMNPAPAPAAVEDPFK